MAAYLEGFNGEELSGRMCVRSSYQNNRIIVQLEFMKVFSQVFDRKELGNRTKEDFLRAVSSCQGMEYGLMIFNDWCGTMRERLTGSYYLLDSLRELYVMDNWARCNLIIILSMNYLQASLPNWEAIINYFGGTQNS